MSTPAPGKSVKLWTPAYTMLLLVNLFSGMAGQMVVPIVAKYALHLGATLSVASTIASLMSLMGLFCCPFAGLVSDRVNRKWLIDHLRRYQRPERPQPRLHQLGSGAGGHPPADGRQLLLHERRHRGLHHGLYPPGASGRGHGLHRPGHHRGAGLRPRRGARPAGALRLSGHLRGRGHFRAGRGAGGADHPLPCRAAGSSGGPPRHPSRGSSSRPSCCSSRCWSCSSAPPTVWPAPS